MCARAESGRVLRGAVAKLADAVDRIAEPVRLRPEPPRTRQQLISGQRRYE